MNDDTRKVGLLVFPYQASFVAQLWIEEHVGGMDDLRRHEVYAAIIWILKIRKGILIAGVLRRTVWRKVGKQEIAIVRPRPSPIDVKIAVAIAV